jgi:hypothetical protein
MSAYTGASQIPGVIDAPAAGIDYEKCILALAKTDLRDRLEVFFYDNLAAIITPNSTVLLTPGARAALVADINYLPGGFCFPKDLQDILNAFILVNLNQISTTPTVALIPTMPTGPLSPTAPLTPTEPFTPVTPLTPAP